MTPKRPIARADDIYKEMDRENAVEDGEELNSDADQAREPKYAQYLDSDEAAEEDESQSEGETSASGADNHEEVLRRKMKSIPYSSLLQARKAMGETGQESSDSEEDEFEEERVQRREGKDAKQKVFQDLEKRGSKHAPTEMSSRKPVSRRRTVIETKSNITKRDPRFSSLSASLPNTGLFQSSYGFLREKQTTEVAELREAYNKLKRQGANHAGPKAKSEIARNIQKEKEEVEFALRRAEGLENERRKREREGEVIKREKKAIQERVKEGGKTFYLKDSAKKQLILKDKFDRLAGSSPQEKGKDDGSTRKDLKRAIEKRRKKNAAKEWREMPLGDGVRSFPSSGNAGIPKRMRAAAGAASIAESKPLRKRGRRG